MEKNIDAINKGVVRKNENADISRHVKGQTLLGISRVLISLGKGLDTTDSRAILDENGEETLLLRV